MNEKIALGQDMKASGRDMEAVISAVMDNALVTRPKRSVYYRPFLKCEGAGFTRTLGSQRVDLNRIYPGGVPGVGVIADFYIACQTPEEIYLNVSGNIRVWFEQQCIYDGIGKETRAEINIHLPVSVKPDADNSVRILCVKEEDREFAFEFLISVKRYPSMWANDYLFGARAVLPIQERAGEEGVALSPPLTREEYGRTDMNSAEIAYRWPPALAADETFDFRKLYTEGDISYVYTEAACAHVLKYGGTVERILINGSYAADGHCAGTGSVRVKAGDRLLFRCRRSADGWKLRLKTERLCLPFLTSIRGTGDRAVCIGPFFGTQCHGPEYDWDLSKVFVNQKGRRIYWRFCDGSELRIYLDSVFFGQWFYALMVGFYGIRDAAILSGRTDGQRLFCENMSALAKYFDYIEYDIQQHVMPAFMPRLYDMSVLDNIGTMGMNLADAYLDCNDRALLPLIERIRHQAEHSVPRMEDGTYYRRDTMWADDLYMSCPFLVRMGRLTGDDEWYRKAQSQIRGFKKRLYMEEEHLFSHIYFTGRRAANRVPWGRGNGWVVWTLTEFLMYADGYIDVSEEKKLFYDMAHSIRALQDESGLWRQVLNRREEGSYPETSCTGMFLLAFTRGVKYGWLEKDFLDCMEKAWNGLLVHSIDGEGNVYGVCMGSGCAMEAEYYYTIPTVKNDDHGTGVILAAGAEYAAFKKDLEEKNESETA